MVFKGNVPDPLGHRAALVHLDDARPDLRDERRVPGQHAKVAFGARNDDHLDRAAQEQPLGRHQLEGNRISHEFRLSLGRRVRSGGLGRHLLRLRHRLPPTADLHEPALRPEPGFHRGADSPQNAAIGRDDARPRERVVLPEGWLDSTEGLDCVLTEDVAETTGG